MKVNFSTTRGASLVLLAGGAWLAVFSACPAAQAAARWMQGGHAARITGVACSPDGVMIASSSEDGTVKLWSTNGTLLGTLSTQPYPATAVAWSPDGRKIAVGTYSGDYVSTSRGIPGQIYLWQSTNGWAATNVSLVRVITNRYGKITTLAFSPDNLRLAYGCAEGSNVVHAVSDGSVVATRPAYNTAVGPAAVTSVAFSSTGRMASGCEDNTLRVYDSAWNQLWSSITFHTNSVTAVTFSPDGSLLASASLDQTVQLRSTATWTLQQTLTGHSSGVLCVAFSRDGQRIVTGGMDGTIKVWNLSGACLVTIAAPALPVTATAFSPDGEWVVSGSDDGTVRRWSVADGSALATLGGQSSFIGAVVISPDGTLCASSGGDEVVKVRNTGDGFLVCALAGHTNHVISLAFSPDSRRLATGGGVLDPSIKIWRISDGALLRTIPATTNGVMAMAWSPAGELLAAGGDSTEQCIRLWTASDGALVRTLPGHSGGVTALAFSAGGDLLASGGRRFDHVVKIWSVANGNLLRTLSGHGHNIEAIAFAPDGDTVASGSSGSKSLKVWKISDGSSRDFGSSTNPVFALAFTADGSTLASADRDAIHLWDVGSGGLVEIQSQETVRVSSLAYSPNANLLLHGREDATLVLSANTRGAQGRPPLVFQSLTVGGDNATALMASVQPWTRHVIQGSSDLAEWTFLTWTFSHSNVLVVPSLESGTNPARFYRALTPP